MTKRSAVVVALVMGLYAFMFGVLFGSHLGAFGDLVHAVDFTLKTKIINSLAVFGYACVGIGIWSFAAAKPPPLFALGLALWVSAFYGFLSPDCAIFNFCGWSGETEVPACTSNYDKQGAHAECE